MIGESHICCATAVKTSPLSKSWTSQRGRRSVWTTFRISPRFKSIRQNQLLAATGPVTPRRESPPSLPPTNRAARAAIEKRQEHDEDITAAHVLDYSDEFEDSNPVLTGVTPVEVEAHNMVIEPFGEEELYDVLNSNKSAAKEVWLELISTLRSHSFRTWLKGLTYKWCRFLWSCGVDFDNERDVCRAEALTRRFFRKEQSPSSPISTKSR